MVVIKNFNKAISDCSLKDAMRIVTSVKQPPFIPTFEVLTLAQVAKYLGVEEGMVRSEYTMRRREYADDVCMLSYKDILPLAKETEDLGVWGKRVKFSNGVQTCFSYTPSTAFNARAILRFGVAFESASKIAAEIVKRITNPTIVAPLAPWFKLKFSDGVNADIDKIENESNRNEETKVPGKISVSVTMSQVKIENDVTERKPKPVVRTDRNGKNLRTFSNVREAANKSKVSVGTIYAACNGRLKSGGGYIWKYLSPNPS